MTCKINITENNYFVLYEFQHRHHFDALSTIADFGDCPFYFAFHLNLRLLTTKSRVMTMLII